MFSYNPGSSLFSMRRPMLYCSDMLPTGLDWPGESRMADYICVSWRPSCLWSGTFTVSHTARVSWLTLKPCISQARFCHYGKVTNHTMLNSASQRRRGPGGWVCRLRPGNNLFCCLGNSRPTYIGLRRNPQERQLELVLSKAPRV